MDEKDEAAEARGDHEKDPVAARRWYRRALALDPGNPRLQDKLEDAVLRVLESAIRRRSPSDPKLHPLRVVHLQYSIRSYERRVRAAPSDGLLHYKLGRLYSSSGRIDRAKAEFLACLTQPEIRSRGHFHLAQCFMKEGQFKTALLHLEKCEEDIPLGDFHSDIQHLKARCRMEGRP